MKYCYVTFVMFFVIPSFAMEKKYITLTDGSRTWYIFEIQDAKNSRFVKVCKNKSPGQFYTLQKAKLIKDTEFVYKPAHYDHGLLLGNCLGALFMSLRELCNSKN